MITLFRLFFHGSIGMKISILIILTLFIYIVIDYLSYKKKMYVKVLEVENINYIKVRKLTFMGIKKEKINVKIDSLKIPKWLKKFLLYIIKRDFYIHLSKLNGVEGYDDSNKASKILSKVTKMLTNEIVMIKYDYKGYLYYNEQTINYEKNETINNLIQKVEPFINEKLFREKNVLFHTLKIKENDSLLYVDFCDLMINEHGAEIAKYYPKKINLSKKEQIITENNEKLDPITTSEILQEELDEIN